MSERTLAPPVRRVDAFEMTLSAGGLSVPVNHGRAAHGGASGRLWCETLSGWWSTPMAKVGLSERASGDGAHRMADDAILYSSRVVQLGLVADGDDRSGTAAAIAAIGALAHRHVTLTVDDGTGETSATGYLEAEWSEEAWHGHQRGTVTLTCEDPRRYGRTSRGYMNPAANMDGGLLYDSGTLLLPVSFAGEAPEGASCTIANGGTSVAYPTITAKGAFPEGVEIAHPGGLLAFSGPISASAPLVLDSLTRTASVGGRDVTRSLSRRDFPTVPPGGGITLAVTSSGSGTVVAECRDTYV